MPWVSPDHLDLDVAGGLEVALEEDLVRTEGGRRLALGRGHGVGQLARRTHEAHAAAAAAGRRLDQEGIPDARGGGLERGPGGAGLHHDARQDGHAGRAASSLARALCPMTRMASGGGPTQTMPAAAHASARAGFSDRKP